VTILPQLERDLFNAAEERLRADATAPNRLSSSPASSLRARLGQAAAGLPLILSAAVAIAIAVIAVAVLGHGHQASQGTTASGPSGGGSPRSELVRALGVLRRPQTKADLQGLERLDRLISAHWQLRMGFKQWGYREADRRLVRVVNVPAWRAKVLIAPIRLPPSPTSGQGREGVQLVLWWTGTTFPSPTSLIASGAQPTSVGAVLAHGLWAGTVVLGLNPVSGVVHGPDVQDGVLLVPDGVASVKLGRATAAVTPPALSRKALNAALAAIQGTAAVHDNIAAFHLPIAVYTGRPPHWSHPGPTPKYWFSGIGTTVQYTWFDARGHVVRRTTAQIVLTVRIPAQAGGH
jgi:hypothetical protein